MEEIATRFLPGSLGMLSPIQSFLDDKDVSEILINKPGEIFVERKGVMQRHEIKAFDSLHLRRLFTLIANENGQGLNEESPILSGNLDDGSRVQLIIPPASGQYTLSIRKFILKSLSMEDYANTNFFHDTIGVGLKVSHQTAEKSEKLLCSYYEAQKWQTFIATAIKAKKTIVISGATSSGKTTFLNACLREISLEERLITLEDTFEINAPHQNMVRLKALKQIGQLQPLVTMQDLVQASLRLRPDRIIMGEIRGKEILDFISACLTGHNGSLATIHADSPRMAFMRMAQLYKLNNVPGMRDADINHLLHETIDIVVQLKRTSLGPKIVSVYYKSAHHD